MTIFKNRTHFSKKSKFLSKGHTTQAKADILKNRTLLSKSHKSQIVGIFLVTVFIMEI